MENNNSKIKLSGLRKEFGDVVAVKDIDLDIYEGDFLTLLGPSGCGKTTTLRAISGLEEASGGKIFIDGKLVFSKEDEIIVAPSKRNLGLIFQSYALWPHMSVYENIAFGLKVKKLPADEIKKRVEDILKDVQLEEYGERYPSELSGGQQQRVAIARMLINRPQIFLMDEPLSNLDARLRMEMRSELKQLHTKTKATTIYVTHDQEEAMTLSTRICVMNEGVIRQVGTPEEVYSSPADVFVAGFISNPKMNFFNGKVEKINNKIFIEAGGFSVEVSSDIVGNRSEVRLAVRPEDISISDTGVPYTVQTRLPTGSSQIVMAEDQSGNSITLLFNTEQVFQVGDVMRLSIKQKRFHLFDNESGLRLN